MKTSTNTLTGLALNYAVARAEGLDVYVPAFAERPWLQYRDCHGQSHHCPDYCGDWSAAGPIIEREQITIGADGGGWCAGKPWDEEWMSAFVERGASPLVAAMRTYVISKLGDIVDIPEELL